MQGVNISWMQVDLIIRNWIRLQRLTLNLLLLLVLPSPSGDVIPTDCAYEWVMGTYDADAFLCSYTSLAVAGYDDATVSHHCIIFFWFYLVFSNLSVIVSLPQWNFEYLLSDAGCVCWIIRLLCRFLKSLFSTVFTEARQSFIRHVYRCCGPNVNAS